MRELWSPGLAELPAPSLSPPGYAVAQRDVDVVRLVGHVVRHRQAMLALQPVVHGRAPDRIAFREGLILIRDATGRILSAIGFMPAVEDMKLGPLIDTLVCWSRGCGFP